MFSVALYLMDRAYGGPEEGGWYYDVGQPASFEDVSDRIPFDDFKPRFFLTEDEAIGEMGRLGGLYIERLNEGRRSISSVLSEGEYGFCIAEGMPKAWPDRRPHYE